MFGRLLGETSQAWLERVLACGGTDAQINAVLAIYEKERAKSTVQSANDLLFNYSVKSKFDFPPYDGGKIIFQREWFIEKTLKEVLTEDSNGLFDSFYWRAPPGSGKSVFLQVLGKRLQDQRCLVYFLSSARDLDTYPKRFFNKLAESVQDKVVVLLIDEVQSNMDSGHWVDLLKSRVPKNLIVLGVGISMAWPAFSTRYPDTATYTTEDVNNPMFLAANDLDEIVEVFSLKWNRSQELTMMACKDILNYTNGHIYPFVTIADYVLNPLCNVDLQGLPIYLASERFFESDTMTSIRDRCFHTLNCQSFEKAKRLLTDNCRSDDDMSTFFDLGLLKPLSSNFISPLLVAYMFSKMEYSYELRLLEKIYINEKENSSPVEEQVIAAGISHLKEEHLKDAWLNSDRAACSVGMHWALSVKARVPNVWVSAQQRLPREAKYWNSGSLPLVYFVNNKKCNMWLQVAINPYSDADLRWCLARYGDADNDLTKNGFVLHIDMENDEPKVKLAEPYNTEAAVSFWWKLSISDKPTDIDQKPKKY